MSIVNRIPNVSLPRYLLNPPPDQKLFNTYDITRFESDSQVFIEGLRTNDPLYIKNMLDSYLTKAVSERKAIESTLLLGLEIDQEILQLNSQIQIESVAKARLDSAKNEIINFKSNMSSKGIEFLNNALKEFQDCASKFQSKSWVSGCVSAWDFTSNDNLGWGMFQRDHQEARSNRERAANAVVFDQIHRDTIFKHQLNSQVVQASAQFQETLFNMNRQHADIQSNLEVTKIKADVLRQSLELANSKKEVLAIKQRIPYLIERYIFNYWLSYFLCNKLIDLINHQTEQNNLFIDLQSLLKQVKNGLDCDPVLHCAQHIGARLDVIASSYQTASVYFNVKKGIVNIPPPPDSDRYLYWLKGVSFFTKHPESWCENAINFTPGDHTANFIYGAPLLRGDSTALMATLPPELVNLNPCIKWSIKDVNDKSVSDVLMRIDLIKILRENIVTLTKSSFSISKEKTNDGLHLK
jgi:hypothetical protein